jgi:hypothetical protein
MTSDPLRWVIALCLAAHGIYMAAFLPGMLGGPSSIMALFVAFLLQAVLAIIAAIGTAQRLAWAPPVIVLLGAVVAATWLVEGFVFGVVAYLYALFAAVLAILAALATAAYLSGRWQLRLTSTKAESRSLRPL